MTNTDDVLNSLRFLFPKPSPVPLIRIGGFEDGAYLVPDDLHGVAACFSPGVANFKRFEDQLLQDFGIRSHMVDFTSDVEHFATPLIGSQQSFRKLWLEPEDSATSISLSSWVQQHEPSEADLILQMDIEGAEYRNLLAVEESTLRRFRILLIEFHGLELQHNPTFFRSVVTPTLERLSRHFVCVHAHANNAGGSERINGTGLEVPRLIEVSLLRKDRFVGLNRENLIAPRLPHPLDLQVNTPDLPPLFLAREWREFGVRDNSDLPIIHDAFSTHSGACIRDLYAKLHDLQAANQNLRRELGELSVVRQILKALRRLSPLNLRKTRK